jgi:hypothetical protein
VKLTALQARDYVRARTLLEESLALARRGRDVGHIAVTLANLGLLTALEEDFATVGAILRESLPLVRERGDVRLADESLIVALPTLPHPATNSKRCNWRDQQKSFARGPAANGRLRRDFSSSGTSGQ